MGRIVKVAYDKAIALLANSLHSCSQLVRNLTNMINELSMYPTHHLGESNTRIQANNSDSVNYTTTTPPALQNHHAIQNYTQTSQHSNRHLHRTIHSKYSTLHPALCPHTCIQNIFLPKHHKNMEQPTTCHNQQHNHTTT